MIRENLAQINIAQMPIDDSWAFHGASRKETTYATHGYHRYPAKFIPQIAGKLIRAYSKEGDKILDPFAGCGTTLVEAKIHGRESIGIDINPVATLITEAKCTPADAKTILRAHKRLESHFSTFRKNSPVKIPQNARIDYWFCEEEKRKLAFMLEKIRKLRNDDVRLFFLCAFSNILKSCSIWMQKSNKPTRDFNKIPADPFHAFPKQVKKMAKGAEALSDVLTKNDRQNITSQMICADARSCQTIEDESVHLVVTSPPYVTSYEYADLHQLSSLWLGYSDDLREFRKDFVGTSCLEGSLPEQDPAHQMVERLHGKSRKMGSSVAAYFSDMKKIFSQMHRILKPKGKMCIVIGNTKLKGVEIKNAEIFCSYLQTMGMPIIKTIKREIPSKNLPSLRDRKTGRFTSVKGKNKRLAYPFEYILIAEKH